MIAVDHGQKSSVASEVGTYLTAVAEDQYAAGRYEDNQLRRKIVPDP